MCECGHTKDEHCSCGCKKCKCSIVKVLVGEEVYKNECNI